MSNQQPSAIGASPLAPSLTRDRHPIQRQMFWLVAAFVLVSGLLAAVALAYLREQTIDLSRRLTSSFAHILEEQTARTIQALDERLQLTASGLSQLRASGGLNGASARALLREQMKEMPFVRAMWVMDAKGRITHSSDPGNIGVNLADRDYFEIYHEQPEIMFYLGAPVRGRTTGTWALGASRPLRSTTGAFVGIVAAALEPTYFDRVWRKVQLAGKGSITLFRRDGVLMMRSPFDDAAMGKTFRDLPMFRALETNPTGSFRGASPVDETIRLRSYQTLTAYPDLIIVVGESYEAVLAPWRRLAEVALGIWGTASLAIIILSIFLSQAWQEALRSEALGDRMAERLTLATRATSIAIWDWDVTTDTMFASPAYFTMMGRDPEERLAGREQWLERVHPEDRDTVARKIRAALTGGDVGYQYEARLLHADGSFRWVSSVGSVLGRDPDGRATRLLGAREDITERKRSEEALRVSEQRFRTIFAAEPECVKVMGPDGTLLEMNPAGLAMLEVSSVDQVKGHSLAEFIRPEYRAAFFALHGRAIGGEAGLLQFEITGLRGTRRWLETHATPMRDAQGGQTLMLAVTRDISERKRAEEALRASEQRLRDLVESTNGVVWEADASTLVFSFVSKYAERLFGYPVASWLAPGFWASHIHPEDRDQAVQLCLTRVARLEDHEFEYRFIAQDGRFIWLRDCVRVIVENGKPRWLRGLMVDITASEATQSALQSSLREKEALLKEVHHRVKNNLQVITSLLRLETSRSAQPATRDVLKEMQSRIRSMALLHETLYKTGNFARVDLADYLRQLATQLFRGQNASPSSVLLALDLAPRQVAIEQAIPCGLIVNELLTNSLKHGFVEGRRGEVRLGLQRAAEGQVRLQVSDDGVGLPADFDSKRGNSLGLQLVSDLSRQLGGTLEVGPGPSAVFTVTFRGEEPQPTIELFKAPRS